MSRIEHFAVYAENPAALKDFYVTALGLHVIVENPGPPPAYFLADDRGMAVEVLARPEGQANANQRWVCHFAFWVDDYSATRQDLERRGIVFEEDTLVENDDVKTAFFKDPAGNRCQIVWSPPAARQRRSDARAASWKARLLPSRHTCVRSSWLEAIILQRKPGAHDHKDVNQHPCSRKHAFKPSWVARLHDLPLRRGTRKMPARHAVRAAPTWELGLNTPADQRVLVPTLCVLSLAAGRNAERRATLPPRGAWEQGNQPAWCPSDRTDRSDPSDRSDEMRHATRLRCRRTWERSLNTPPIAPPRSHVPRGNDLSPTLCVLSPAGGGDAERPAAPSPRGAWEQGVNAPADQLASLVPTFHVGTSFAFL